MSYIDNQRFIDKTLTQAAQFEQMAEEASEVAQAALKAARILRGENPTPVTYTDALTNLEEELSDLTVCMDVLEVKPCPAMCRQKMARWADRLIEMEALK